MVAVPRRKHLDSHAEIAGGLPHVRAGLHQPSRCGVPKCVRDDIITEPGVLHGTRKCFTNALYRVAIPLDGKPLSLPFPASQVCQQLRRQWDGRLTLLRLTLARWASVKDAAVEIYITGARHPLECGAAECARLVPV